MRLSETTNKVIHLARIIREYYDIESPKYYPNYPATDISEEGPPQPREKQELRELFKSLPPEMIYQLILIMYLGRGDFGVDELANQYQTLQETFIKPEWAIAQMMEKAPLADYLSDGLLELAQHQISVDDLPLANREEARA